MTHQERVDRRARWTAQVEARIGRPLSRSEVYHWYHCTQLDPAETERAIKWLRGPAVEGDTR